MFLAGARTLSVNGAARKQRTSSGEGRISAQFGQNLLELQKQSMNVGKEGDLKVAKSNRGAERNLLGNFIIKKTLGEGSYGTVELVENDGQLLAMKVIQKKKLEKEEKQYQALIEKELLKRMDHPGIVKLHSCFQDKKNLYFGLEYCAGGDFTSFIQENEKLIYPAMRVFYVAEIIVILEYLSSIGVVHRDLKPDNILLTKDRHLKLIDFGTAQISECRLLQKSFKEKLEIQKSKSAKEQQLKQDFSPNKGDDSSSNDQKEDTDSQEEEQPARCRHRKATFVGTCYYLSPELIEDNQCSPSSDLWALGCIIYELFTLEPPFSGNSQYEIFEKIIAAEFSFPANRIIPEEAKDLIQKLLKKDPEERLGCGSRKGLMFEDLKAHPFFTSITNFSDQIFRMEAPKLVPQIQMIKSDSMKLDRSAMLKQQVQALKTDPNVLFCGMVEKRTFISYNMYYLAVFKDLTMVRIKVEEPQKRVRIEIALDRDFDTNSKKPAELIDEKSFRLVTKQKVYKLKAENAPLWVDTINEQYDFLKDQKICDALAMTASSANLS